MFHFYTLLMFSGGIEVERWLKMGEASKKILQILKLMYFFQQWQSSKTIR